MLKQAIKENDSCTNIRLGRAARYLAKMVRMKNIDPVKDVFKRRLNISDWTRPSRKQRKNRSEQGSLP